VLLVQQRADQRLRRFVRALLACRQPSGSKITTICFQAAALGDPAPVSTLLRRSA
jgi:hypothetical protein